MNVTQSSTREGGEGQGIAIITIQRDMEYKVWDDDLIWKIEFVKGGSERDTIQEVNQKKR